MSRTQNRIGLAEQVKVGEWLRENWESRVIKNAMSVGEVADTIAKDKGIPKLTPGNVRGVMKELFPQWNFIHAADNPDLPGMANARLSERLNDVENQQAEWNKWLDQWGKSRELITENLLTLHNQLEEKVKELEAAIVRMNGRLANLEKELGVKPMTSFLPPEVSKVPPVHNPGGVMPHKPHAPWNESKH